MTKTSIMAGIDAKCGSSYTIWRIGLTHDPVARKQEWKDAGENVTYWRDWEADSLADAQAIETYYINEKKMKGGTGGDMSPHKRVWVYVF